MARCCGDNQTLRFDHFVEAWGGFTHGSHEVFWYDFIIKAMFMTCFAIMVWLASMKSENF